MSDYEYCKKHDTSFLMPELLMCPKCAIERLRAGDVPEPLGDALIEAFDTLEKDLAAEKERSKSISKNCQDTAITLAFERKRMFDFKARVDNEYARLMQKVQEVAGERDQLRDRVCELANEVATLKADRAVIDAWNNNQSIEVRLKGTDKWHPCDDPRWCYTALIQTGPTMKPTMKGKQNE